MPLPRPHPHVPFVLLGLSALAGLLGACEERSPRSDAGPWDALGSEGGANVDGGSGAFSVDFTVSDCPGVPGDAGADAGAAGCCRGPAPLTLTFVPLTAGPVTRFLWQFGDETSSTQLTPTHTYALPNRYDVTLVAGGPTGTLARTKPACIEVSPNPLGATCDVDVQCGPQASCVCGAAAQCPAPFFRGLCSQGCRDAPCPAATVCGDLSLGGAATPEAPWRRPLCLAECVDDTSCATGLACRTLPGRFPTGQWVRGCFPRYPLAPGVPCRNVQGALDSASCVTGLCANLGSVGLCSLDCHDEACPPGLACARFANGEALCVPSCTNRKGCDEDALLGCEAVGGQGPLAYEVEGATSNDRYCVPKSCKIPSDCGGAPCVTGDAASGRCRRDEPVSPVLP